MFVLNPTTYNYLHSQWRRHTYGIMTKPPFQYVTDINWQPVLGL